MEFTVYAERRLLHIFGSCKQFCRELEVCLNAVAQNSFLSVFLSHNDVSYSSRKGKSGWCHSNQGRSAYVVRLVMLQHIGSKSHLLPRFKFGFSALQPLLLVLSSRILSSCNLLIAAVSVKLLATELRLCGSWLWDSIGKWGQTAGYHYSFCCSTCCPRSPAMWQHWHSRLMWCTHSYPAF